VPALTLRTAPLPRVAALRALPAVVVAVAGGAGLALAVAIAFGVDLGSGAAVCVGVAGACGCVSGWMVGTGGHAPAAAVLAVAAMGAVVVAAQTDSNPARAPREAARFDVAPAPAPRTAPPKETAPTREAPPRPVRPVVAAGKLVRSYYAAIDAGDFPTAWRRLSPAVQAGFGGFAVWRGGYATTLGQRVEAVEVDGAQIRHVLVARDRTRCGTAVEQRFLVTWTVSAGTATSLHAVKVAGQDPAAAC
jgi:hypothetical protein